MGVGINFLSGFANDNRGLRALNHRLGRLPWGAKLLGFWNRGETARKKFTFAIIGTGGIFGGADAQRDTSDKVIAVLVVARMAFERERISRCQAARAGLALQEFVLRLKFVQP